ncbi:MAG: fasciclin domain-containing protein [Bacteroidia bacterium]|nr:fasciclin domain-containing protein [Bacteroidia bacterium]
MKGKKNYLRSISVLGMAIMLLFSGCENNVEEGMNIIDTLSSDSNFSTLVAALQKAEVTSYLEDYSSFTIFAPTNAAFDELFSNLGVSSIKDISSEYLDSILYYHILYTELTSSLFVNGYISTLSAGPDLQGIIMLINATESTLNRDVNITDFDIMASNGIIHVIDKVLLPPTVFDITIQNGDFTHFVEGLNEAELDSILNETGPYTIFAPTDAAFETLFTDLGVTGIADLTKEQLIPILQNHIVNGNLRSTDLVSGYVSTLNGDILVDIGTSVVINSSTNVIEFDLQGKNGVVHVIDEVLIPGKN